jgi:hypothetical protein
MSMMLSADCGNIFNDPIVLREPAKVRKPLQKL